MKSMISLLVILILWAPLSFALEDYPPITLPGTELHPFESKLSDRSYQLHVALPDDYEQEPQKHYPVLYVTDGYWNTNLIDSMYGNLMYDQTAPQFILVGLGYADPEADYGKERMYDLVPSAVYSEEELEQLEPLMGGGDEFLEMIKTEVVPYVETTFRVDPDYRVIGGSSMGGFFTIYAMLQDPTFFDAYISISPAAGFGERWLFQLESQYRHKNPWDRNHTRLPARLFMSAASAEWTGFKGEILAFDQILKHGEYVDFEYHFKLVDDEAHAGTKAEGYSRGIRYAFKPYLKSLSE